MHTAHRDSPQLELKLPIKIFLSCAHEDSTVVRKTAVVLSNLGLTAFLAARDIPPAREWLPRLEHELTTSTALAAFLSPAFRASAWADQEVGYALAKKMKVLPIQLDIISVPHGFIERYQAVLASEMTPHNIALSIFDSLLDYDDTRQSLKYLVISRLRSQRSESSLRMWAARLARLPRLSDTEIKAVSAAVDANSMITTDPFLRSDIETIIRRLRTQIEPETL